MIRRSPTRLELKLEDLADFDYIQKLEKKKAPNAASGTGLSATEAQKFARQDRIGFRPPTLRTDGGGGCTTTGTFYSTGTNTTGSSGAGDAGPGILTVEASTSTIEEHGGEATTGTSASGVAESTNRSGGSGIAEMDTSGEDGESVIPSNVTVESNVSNVDMSMDESL